MLELELASSLLCNSLPATRPRSDFIYTEIAAPRRFDFIYTEMAVPRRFDFLYTEMAASPLIFRRRLGYVR